MSHSLGFQHLIFYPIPHSPSIPYPLHFSTKLYSIPHAGCAPLQATGSPESAAYESGPQAHRESRGAGKISCVWQVRTTRRYRGPGDSWNTKVGGGAEGGREGEGEGEGGREGEGEGEGGREGEGEGGREGGTLRQHLLTGTKFGNFRYFQCLGLTAMKEVGYVLMLLGTRLMSSLLEYS